MAAQQTYRLIQQLDVCACREDELVRLTRILAQNSAEKQVIDERVEKARDANEKRIALKAKVAQQYDEIVKQYQAHEAEDKKLREELSADLGVKIQAINQKLQDSSQERAAALEENAQLKEKLKILDENTSEGSDKFSSLIELRGSETQKIQDRIAAEVEKEAELKKLIVEQEEQLPTAREELAAIKEKVNEMVARFTEFQKRMETANKVVTQGKEEKDRGLKRIAAADKEVVEAQKRCERAKKDHDAEAVVAQRLTDQLASLEAQTTKLQDLTKVLRGEKPAAAPKHVDPATA